jgi:hypothetical protein
LQGKRAVKRRPLRLPTGEWPPPIESDEPEVTLFNIPGQPSDGGNVVDVNSASRLDIRARPLAPEGKSDVVTTAPVSAVPDVESVSRAGTPSLDDLLSDRTYDDLPSEGAEPSAREAAFLDLELDARLREATRFREDVTPMPHDVTPPAPDVSPAPPVPLSPPSLAPSAATANDLFVWPPPPTDDFEDLPTPAPSTTIRPAPAAAPLPQPARPPAVLAPAIAAPSARQGRRAIAALVVVAGIAALAISLILLVPAGAPDDGTPPAVTPTEPPSSPVTGTEVAIRNPAAATPTEPPVAPGGLGEIRETRPPVPVQPPVEPVTRAAGAARGTETTSTSTAAPASAAARETRRPTAIASDRNPEADPAPGPRRDTDAGRVADPVQEEVVNERPAAVEPTPPATPPAPASTPPPAPPAPVTTPPEITASRPDASRPEAPRPDAGAAGPPPATPPPRAPAVAASATREVTASEGMAATLKRLELAYEQRDTELVKQVWPSVDARALGRAFGNLRSQQVTFDRCETRVSEPTGEMDCRGVITYVPRVGGPDQRTESRQWRFRMEKKGDSWVIGSATAR